MHFITILEFGTLTKSYRIHHSAADTGLFCATCRKQKEQQKGKAYKQHNMAEEISDDKKVVVHCASDAIGIITLILVILLSFASGIALYYLLKK